MKAELIKTFRFEAAHSLEKLPEGHRCRRIHGHSYRLDVHVSGEVDVQSGMVIDFHDIQKVVKPLVEQLDHRLLNDVPGLENSTSESDLQIPVGPPAAVPAATVRPDALGIRHQSLRLSRMKRLITKSTKLTKGTKKKKRN